MPLDLKKVIQGVTLIEAPRYIKGSDGDPEHLRAIRVGAIGSLEFAIHPFKFVVNALI